MVRAILIDRLMGETRPSLATPADLMALEVVPFRERIAAASTYEALRLGAAHDPMAPALQFLQNADPTDPALIISHGEFFRRVTQAANLFSALGVGPNEVVSLMLPLVPQSFYALFGAEAAGIANPVNALLEPHQLAEILQAANTKVLVALGPTPGSDIWAKVERMRALVPSLKTIVQVNMLPGAVADAPGVVSFEGLISTFPGDHLTSGRQIALDDTAAYFHTGGTTGTPKLVRHSHENQVHQAWALNVMMLSGNPGRNTLFGMPLYHVGGALTQALATLVGGGSLVVLSASGWRNPLAVRHIWRLVDRFKPTVLGSVPTVLAAAAGVPSGDADTSSIQVISGGGSAIPVALGLALGQRFSAPVLEVYGMTETSSVHTMSYPDRAIRLGSVGHAVPYSQVKIVKLDAQSHWVGDCVPNEIGVIAMSGPGVFTGYLNDTHNLGAFVAPGWVNSGDLGRMDEDGYLWVTGRAKDLIIRGAHNIDPLPIEELFYQHPEVALVAIVGQPDAYAGEVPLAYVQLKPGATVTAAQLLDHVRQRTPERAAVPVAVRLIDAVPLTGVGKVFKPQLRWDAAQTVFAQLLAPLSTDTVKVTVVVVADGQHGTLARVTLQTAGGEALAPAVREAAVQRVHSVLNPFVIRHVVLE